MYHGYGFTYMIMFNVLFFLITLGLVFWIIRSARNQSGKTPEDVLLLRLASGELTLKEYESLRKVVNEKTRGKK